jgi:dTDP-glucose 4,6-dehydratase
MYHVLWRIHLRYVISGAAGFIGSHMCDLLLDEGHTVVAIDNLITGSIDNLSHLRSNPKFEFHEVDVTRSFEIGGNVQCVMHLASLASPKDYLQHPIETLESGSSGTRNMLDVAKRHSATFLLTSTSECYGDPLEHPQKETYWGNVNPVGMRSCYDESKRYAEAVTMAYHRTHGVKTNIARIFNTYGPRMQLKDGRVVPAFLDQVLRGEPLTIYGDGSQTRSFCYVSDMVRGLYLLSKSEERYPVNLGNPREMSMLEFAECIKAAARCEAAMVFLPLPEDDPKRRRPDITKAKQLLGWEPAVPLEQGIAATLDYFRVKAGLTPPIPASPPIDPAVPEFPRSEA